MSQQISHRIHPTEDVLFPEDLSRLGGRRVCGQAEMICSRGDRGVGCLTIVERKLMWLDGSGHFGLQVLADGGRRGIRNATGEDIRDVLRSDLDPGGQNPATTDANWPAAVIARVWDSHSRKSRRIRAQGKEGG